MSVRLATPPEVAGAPLREVEGLFANAERALSRFDAGSELSRLNARAGTWVRVSPLLWEVLGVAITMAEETGGLFDPTLLHALEAAGYTQTFSKVAAGHARPATLRGGNGARFRDLRLRKETREVKVPRGTRLDLGGIAKGYIAQKAAEMLRERGPALVDAGGDLAAGDAPPGWPGWPVAVAAPASQESAAGAAMFLVWLRNGALATSGVDYRRWHVDGTYAHHIIASDTGRPAETDLLTVTVLDPSAARAEAWTTAALVAGARRSAETFAELGLAAVLITDREQVHVTPAMHSFLA
jgi:thiamine biosynthesis lipoprotein